MQDLSKILDLFVEYIQVHVIVEVMSIGPCVCSQHTHLGT